MISSAKKTIVDATVSDPMLDKDSVRKHILTIQFKEYTPDVYEVLRIIPKCARNIPMKYLKLVPGSYTYVAQKSRIFGKDMDIRNAGITIEPMNADICHIISYTPINQSLPLGTIVNLDNNIPYDTLDDGSEPDRLRLTSDDLIIADDIEQKIKAANPKSTFTKPWGQHCLFGSIDIGSILKAKFEVAPVDTSINSGFQIFRFERSDDDNLFRLITYNCFNVTPIDILNMIKEQEKNPIMDKFVSEVLSKSA
jgi:hypothetical protein